MRVEIIKWMVEDATENEEKGVVLRTINQFPSELRGKYNVNNTKCTTRWWKSRAEVDNFDKFNAKSMLTVTGSGSRQVTIKEVAGREQRRAQWIETLHDILLVEFSRFKNNGFKFLPTLLAIIPHDIILTSTEIAVMFGPTYVDPADDIKVIDKIKTRWEANGIVVRMRTGKMLCSSENEAHIEISVAYHMDLTMDARLDYAETRMSSTRTLSRVAKE
uniref:Uncharacterized protein n=1 Tax=Hyaloperonospora arabidopsidis (strain Emoy2) TaxID=559515 RepID=M4BAM8_HYAAE